MFGASTNIRETVFCLIALASVASSGIVGCDTLDCRLENDKNHENCPFAGDGVGTTVLQSNITADGPLTWSIVGNTDRYTMQQASKSDRRLMKSLYLGTPHSFQIQNADYHACTVTLFNITAALQVVPGYDDFPNFSCDTVLGGQCAKDLLAQARGRLDEALLPGGSSEYPCKTVADALMAEALPRSCNLPFGETSWGYIGTDAITYPGTVYPLSEAQGQCDITSQGPSYNIANTAFFQKELHPKSLDAELWRNGTTPVITMFFNDRGTNNEALVEPEVHLTCLRTVPSEKQASENVARRLARASWLAIVAMSFAALVLS